MKQKLMRGLALMLILAMTISTLVGCGKSEQAQKIVFQVGNADVTLDEVWFYCKSVQEYYESYYASMFTSPDVWNTKYPAEREDGSTEESTLQDIAKRSAIRQIRQIKLAVQHAEELGVTLTEAEKESAEDQAKKFMEEVTKEEKDSMGISQELAEQVFCESAMVEKMKTALAEKEGIEISDEEAQISRIYYIYFQTMTTDASGNAVVATEDKQKLAKEDAQKALEKIQGGYDIATVAAASGMGSNSGEITVNVESDLPEAVSEAVSKLKDGETCDKVIAAPDGYYIIQMINTVDEEATADKKEELLAQKEQELLDEKFTEWNKNDDFDYDKDVNWDYMNEIDFVATSSVTESENSASEDVSSSDDGAESGTTVE